MAEKSSDDSKKLDRARELGTYSVSTSDRGSAGRVPKTVSFTVPTMRRPQFKRPDMTNSRWRHGLAAALFIAAILFSGFAGAWFENRDTDNGLIGSSLTSQKKIVTSQSQLISQIAKTVGPSVVSVNVTIDQSTSDSSGSSGSSQDDGMGLFGFQQPEQDQDEEAAGTGIIVSPDIIMTNRHVVPDGTTKVSVTLSDGTELQDVSVLGRTSDTDTLDVAFLKVNNTEGHKLTPAAIGDSGTVQVGDNVVAIGNALGQFQNTVTSGIISGYGRSVEAGSDDGDGTTSSSDTEDLDDLFQTDAAINEGNSGGPLVNLNGQVIGINTAIAGDAQNIGFAIPINDVRGLITQVLKTGKFERPYLGVRYVPLTADVASEYNLSVGNGAFIAPSDDPTSPSVISGGPAAQAGIQVNDIITQVNGINIDQTQSLTGLLDQHEPGDKITLTILRGGSTKHFTVTLGVLPDSDNSSTTSGGQ
jgi:serine protease Do